jgi:hypothetical protein
VKPPRRLPCDVRLMHEARLEELELADRIAAELAYKKPCSKPVEKHVGEIGGVIHQQPSQNDSQDDHR